MQQQQKKKEKKKQTPKPKVTKNKLSGEVHSP